MKVTRATDLSPGASLGAAIRGPGGRILLNAGVRLTSHYIDRIRSMGVSSVFLDDPDTADVVPPQPITEEVRESVMTGLSGAFTALDRMAADTRRNAGRSQSDSFGATGRQSQALAAESAHAINLLIERGDKMIEQLACQEVLTGLNSLKAHDTYTFQHSIDVAIVGTVLARKIGWDKQRVRSFGIGCLLHDVGKVFIDPAILNKPGKLTREENETLRAHPLLGYQAIKSTCPVLGLLVPQVALQHHERQDGTGYPRGLRGSNRLGRHAGLPAANSIFSIAAGGGGKLGEKPVPRIHEFGALSAVADVYDALTSDRPYREGYHPGRAMDAIVEMSGTHLNVEAVELLRRVLPPFPVCSEVRVVDGRYAGHTGIVTAVPKNDLKRPVVRLLNDATGKRVNPVELDLAVDRDVQIEAVGRAVPSPATADQPPVARPNAARKADAPAPLPPAVEEFLQHIDLSSLDVAA